jgi:hypothetical protein
MSPYSYMGHVLELLRVRITSASPLDDRQEEVSCELRMKSAFAGHVSSTSSAVSPRPTTPHLVTFHSLAEVTRLLNLVSCYNQLAAHAGQSFLFFQLPYGWSIPFHNVHGRLLSQRYLPQARYKGDISSRHHSIDILAILPLPRIPQSPLPLYSTLSIPYTTI